jgi:muramidase (phage lysozyme)
MTSAIGDMVGNPAVEDDEGGGGHNSNHDFFSLHTLGNMLKFGVALPSMALHAAGGAGKYLYDTVAGERNSVPTSVRIAIAGASTPSDKLATLKQYYPNAHPTADGDFAFYDPVSKKEMTLNDPGLSWGDLMASPPSIGEGVGIGLGGGIGAVGGGALGAVGGSAIPIVGTTAGGIGGAVVGRSIGSGVGGAYGKEAGTAFAKRLGEMLTGNSSIDTQTPEQRNSEWWKTGGYDAALGLIPAGSQFLKYNAAKRMLTPTSDMAYDAAKAAGYQPSLSQVGNAAGRANEENIIQQGFSSPIKRATNNESVLQGKIDNFLGENASSSKNDLANSLRKGQQESVGGVKAAASDLYENFPFSDTNIPQANQSKTIISDIYKKQGLQEIPTSDGSIQFVQPSGQKLNPAYSFDPAINYNLEKVISGKATESDLASLDSDIGKYLRSPNLVYDKPAQSLQQLQNSIRDDLVDSASAPQQKEAALGWRNYKDLQDKSTNLLGKQEGISQGVDIGEGRTEGQNLSKGLSYFQNTDGGSDTKSQVLGSILNPDEKQTVLAAILKQPSKFPTHGLSQNSIEAATNKYDMGRVVRSLINPKDQPAFQEFINQAQGVSPISQIPTNSSNFAQNWGGKLAALPKKMAVQSALKAAGNGYNSSNIPYASSPISNPVTSALSAIIPAARTANQTIPAYQISRDVLEQGIPQNQRFPGISQPANLDMLLAQQNSPNNKPSANLNDYLYMKPQMPGQPAVTDYLGQPMNRSVYQQPNSPPIQQQFGGLGYQPLDHFNQPPTMNDLDNYMKMKYGNPNAPQPASMDDLNSYMSKTQGYNAPQQQGAEGNGNSQDAINSFVGKLEGMKGNIKVPKAPEIANQDIPAAGAAFLKTLSSPGLEGAGYNTIVGGGQFNDYSDHPHQVGVVTQNGASTAAGRYQITGTTWGDLQNKHPDLTDFSPKNQDKAAMYLARDRYERDGGDLIKDLQSKNPDVIQNIGHTLSPIWTSLPGGIEQGSGANNFTDNVLYHLDNTQPTMGDLNSYITNNIPQDASPMTQNVSVSSNQGVPNLNDYLYG